MPRSPLGDMERRNFMSSARRMLLDRMGKRGGAGYTGGPTAGQFGMMSGTQPAAGESQAFNERNKNRAELGTRFGAMRGKGLEREKISSSERIRAIMEAGATGRNKYTENMGTKRFGMEDATTRRGQDLRYAPGDAFGPPGVDRYQAETERMFPKITQPREPKVYPGEFGIQGKELARPYTIQKDPETGQYYQVPVGKQQQQKPLTVEEQRAWDELRKRNGLR